MSEPATEETDDVALVQTIDVKPEETKESTSTPNRFSLIFRWVIGSLLTLAIGVLLVCLGLKHVGWYVAALIIAGLAVFAEKVLKGMASDFKAKGDAEFGGELEDCAQAIAVLGPAFGAPAIALTVVEVLQKASGA